MEFYSTIQAGNGTYYTQYQVALLSLRLNQIKDYRDMCQQVLSTFANSDESKELHFSAWTCALGAEAVQNYAPRHHDGSQGCRKRSKSTSST
ncbi:MAG: hypothetical protein R3C20_03445 [Planctomycetaceae bacterium]